MADETPVKDSYEVEDGKLKAGPPPDNTGTEEPKQLLQPPTAEEDNEHPFEEERDGNGIAKKIMVAVVIIAIIGVLVYVFAPKSAPTQVTTTISQSFNINSCTTVAVPGVYEITGDISTSVINGSCIKITASNVNIEGLGHAITGSGPFASRKPYSYAVSADSVSNVIVSNLVISKFSYGVYLQNDNAGEVSGITVNNATMSGIYLNSSSNILIYRDNIHGAESPSGGIVVAHGKDNTLDFDTSEYNSYSGLNISNSTGNRVSNSTLIGNPTADISCLADSSFKFSNEFSNTTCYANMGCNFAYCSQTNVQSDISSITLPYNTNECGSINHQGTYSLSSNLNMNNYLNLTLEEGKTAPCILINASNVYLNCNGHAISNAHYGVKSVGQFNVTVGNCNFENNTYGAYLDNMITFKLHNVSANGGSYGVFIVNSTGGSLAGVTSDKNTYGYYVNGTTYTTVSGFTVANNTYGVYLDNSTDVFFKEGTAVSNSKIDFFCSTDTYNSTLLGLSQSACRSTDCNWAPSCPIKYLPGLAAYPVTACTTLTIPGEYQLENNVFSDTGTCFKIKASGVDLNCAGHLVTGPGSTSGYAFDVSNRTNVAINGCKINGFLEGVHAVNAGHISVQHTEISNVQYGLSLTNSSNSDILENNITQFSAGAIMLNYSNESTVDNNHISYGVAGKGIILQGSFNNSVENNAANLSAYGYYISDSRNNMISNNIASGSTSYDYYCSQNSGGVTAQPVSINSGNSKFNCQWLVEAPLIQQLQECQALEGPTYIRFSQDMITSGTYCFSAITSNSSISVSGTTINCAGHTILSTTGGSFAYLNGNGGITVENCILIGFSNPLVFDTSHGSSSGISIVNDTIFKSNVGITLKNDSNSNVNNDTLINVLKGADLYGYDNGAINGDSFSNVTIGVYLNSSSNVNLLDNNFNDTQSGIVLVNATTLTLGKNVFTNSKSYGLFCSGTSGSSASATTDLGTNICPTGASGCSWITSPFCKNK